MPRPTAPDPRALEQAFSQLPRMLAEVGIMPSARQLEMLRTHFELLVRWNSRMNLTAIRDPLEILQRHFVESAYLTKVLELGPGTLVDVGSGAGFPGLPVKVLSPETGVVLLEPVQKKAAFLKEVARSLGLPDIQVLSTRAENADVQGDWVTIRAVKVTPTLLAVLGRLIVPRGTLAVFTVKRDAQAAMERHGGQFEWKVSPIPGQGGLVILTGKCSTWNIPR